MVTVIYAGTLMEGDHASRTDHDVYVYDENNKVLNHISNIYGNEWNHISIQNGEWLDPKDIPTYEDTIQANLDFLTMMNESLEQDNAEMKAQQEVDRADLDYCLMLLEG